MVHGRKTISVVTIAIILTFRHCSTASTIAAVSPETSTSPILSLKKTSTSASTTTSETRFSTRHYGPQLSSSSHCPRGLHRSCQRSFCTFVPEHPRRLGLSVIPSFASSRSPHPFVWTRPSKITLAAVMTSEDGMNSGIGDVYAPSHKDDSPSALPNWRIASIKESILCSPFCHPVLTEDDFPARPIATAAPWSRPAFQSALALHQRLKTCTDPYISSMLKSSLHDLEMAYRLYGPFSMVGSYNGGKDAVVIFHLMRAVHANYCREMQMLNDNQCSDETNGNGYNYEHENDCDQHFMIPRPRVIYFQHQDEFPQVLSLLHQTVNKYDVDMLAFEEGVGKA